MSERTVELVDRLVETFPRLEPLFHGHLADNFGEVLPHVFVGDLTRTIVTEWERGRPAWVLQLLAELEEVFSVEDEEIAELLVVSFLENLPRSGEPGDDIRNALGSHLRTELDRMG